MVHCHLPDARIFYVTVHACFYLRRVDILARIVTFTVPDFSADLRRCPGVAALGSLRKSFFFFFFTFNLATSSSYPFLGFLAASEQLAPG